MGSPPLVEILERHPTRLGAQSRYRVVDLRSRRIENAQPLTVEALESKNGPTITYLIGTHVCAFGRTPEEALLDLRGTLEHRYEDLQVAVLRTGPLSDQELEDWAALKFLVRPWSSPAA